MTQTRRWAVFGIGTLIVSAAMARSDGVSARGNLAHDPVKLPELKINTIDLTYSETEYHLETGIYYWWTITSDGEEEGIAVQAPQLFANSWVNQIVSGQDDVTKVNAQAINSVEFDGAGSMTISFVPIRPGQYDFYTPGYENRGLKGKFVVE